MDVILSKDAKKQFDHLPLVDKKKVRKKLAVLEQDALAGKKLTGEFQGIRSLRVWPYRILYEINRKMKRIEVLIIAHRQGVYN